MAVNYDESLGSVLFGQCSCFMGFYVDQGIRGYNLFGRLTTCSCCRCFCFFYSIRQLARVSLSAKQVTWMLFCHDELQRRNTCFLEPELQMLFYQKGRLYYKFHLLHEICQMCELCSYFMCDSVENQIIFCHEIDE